MEFLTYCTPFDVACRLYFRKRHWFHGLPKITVQGDHGAFGKLNFDFGDENVSFTIYIMDREKILDAAHLAVANFEKLTDRMFEDPYNGM